MLRCDDADVLSVDVKGKILCRTDFDKTLDLSSKTFFHCISQTCVFDAARIKLFLTWPTNIMRAQVCLVESSGSRRYVGQLVARLTSRAIFTLW